MVHFLEKLMRVLLGNVLKKVCFLRKKKKCFVGKRITKETIARLLKKRILSILPLRSASLVNRVFAKDVIDRTNG